MRGEGEEKDENEKHFIHIECITNRILIVIEECSNRMEKRKCKRSYVTDYVTESVTTPLKLRVCKSRTISLRLKI